MAIENYVSDYFDLCSSIVLTFSIAADNWKQNAKQFLPSLDR